MKVDLSCKVKAIDGKLFQTLAADGKTVTDWNCDLKELVYGALTAQLQQDFNLNVAEKMKIYRLAKRVDQADGPINLDSEEITLIKERASKVYGNHQFGAMVDLLEGEVSLSLIERTLDTGSKNMGPNHAYGEGR